MTSTSARVVLGGEPLTVADVLRVAYDPQVKVEIAEEALARVREAARFVARAAASGRQLYGITTGFGACADVAIGAEDAEGLQRNLLVSHACGVGDPLPTPVVRAAMLLRIATLVSGHSGITEPTLRLFVEMLNRGLHPVVPSQGSVGASGDLAPLSHLALPLLGLGQVERAGRVRPGAVALTEAGRGPVHLTFKEGLALNNGTQVTTALTCIALGEVRRLAEVADLALALSLEALCGRREAFDARIHALRRHPGQAQVAARVRALTAGSALVGRDPATVPGKRALPQDAYSLRCAPQVHGASRDVLDQVEEVLAREVDAVTDNPLLFPSDDDVLSGGNFHAHPVAMAADHLKLALAALGNISERRAAKLVDRSQNDGLPAFLIDRAGLNSGLMIPQYTAASLASENKTLAHPASVDTVPTSANTEDHVSMGPIAARHARTMAVNVRRILAVELLTAAQGVDCRLTQLGLTAAALGEGTRVLHGRLREIVPYAREDRDFGADLLAVDALLAEGGLSL